MRSEQRRSKWKIGLICAITAVSLFLIFDFDGDLDFGGQYEILQTVPYSRDKIAFEIGRWDNSSLNGPRYAVIIDDHTPSRFELQRALISFWQRRSFELADQSVIIRWAGPNVLILATDAPHGSDDWVTRQTHRIGDIEIRYSGSP